MNTDHRATARTYYRNVPTLSIGMPEPWWWAVLALGADVINVHFDTDYRGPLAIVGMPCERQTYLSDVDAIAKILKAEGKPGLDAYRCPRRSAGKIVGCVMVRDCYTDATAEGGWFSGPFGLAVEQPLLFPEGSGPSAFGMTDRFLNLSEEKRSAVQYALTRTAALTHPVFP